MAAANTYTPIASTTVDTASATIVFSSIPATYTDLVLVMQPGADVGDENIGLRFNDDTSGNYSYQRIGANNTAGTYNASRQNNFTRINTTEATGTGPTLGKLVITAHIMNYTNTTTYKTVLARSGQVGGTYNGVELFTGAWRATPAAINSITIMQGGARTFSTGSTFNLYGILAA